MALNTVNDIITEILVRNNMSTTDSFVSDTTIQAWVKDAHIWATSLKKWSVTEGRASTTFSSLTTNEDGYLSGQYPEGWKSDSIRLLQIGGKMVKKSNFYKFAKFIEDNPSGSDRIFTDRARTYYINPGIDLTGSIVVWGQYTPILDVTDMTATTVFSNADEEGNEAIVEKASGYLKRRQHLPQEAELHDKRANEKLEEVYKRLGDEQFGYQDTQNDGMFKRFDVLKGGFKEDLFKRDQWY